MQDANAMIRAVNEKTGKLGSGDLINSLYSAIVRVLTADCGD